MLSELFVRKHMRTLFTSILGLALLSAATTQLAVAAETRWYDVEVIIFSHNSQQYRNSEVWPVDYELPQTEASQALLPASSSGSPVAFAQLPPSSLRLTSKANRIKSAADMNLLMHMGWRQPGLSENKAVAVRIEDGSHRLSGTLKLTLSRYLHINTDLFYREPRSGSGAQESAEAGVSLEPRYQAYHMKQSRRMRSRELHYLDHPLFGMAIMVTPYDAR